MGIQKAVVIGKSGQVARALVSALEGADLLLTSSKGGALPLDLGDPVSIQQAFEEIEKRWPGQKVEIFLPGAMTHVDNCERDKEICERLNSTGPALVARECRQRGYALTFFSSEYVFGQAEYDGGQVGPFVESDTPSPSSWYGESKLRAENHLKNIFQGSEKDLLIIRTTMIFSWDLVGMNFLMQYFRQLEEASKGVNKSFRIPIDQISTPAYAPFLASDCVALRNKGASGIFHLVGADLLSRKDLVFLVGQKFGFSKEIVESAFTFVKTEALAQLARRPLTCGLRSERIEEFGLKTRTLEQAFQDISNLRKA